MSSRPPPIDAHACFLFFFEILYRANFIVVAAPPRPMVNPSSTNPTGAATMVAMLAIPTSPTPMATVSAIVSTMDKVTSILLGVRALQREHLLDIVRFFF